MQEQEFNQTGDNGGSEPQPAVGLQEALHALTGAEEQELDPTTKRIRRFETKDRTYIELHTERPDGQNFTWWIGIRPSGFVVASSGLISMPKGRVYVVDHDGVRKSEDATWKIATAEQITDLHAHLLQAHELVRK